MILTIDIICPLYNAESYLVNLHQSLLKQENVSLNKIHYILTKSNDDSEKILKSFNKKDCDYEIIQKNEFSHSLVREKAGFKSNADIIVFVTQDIKIKTVDWLEKLVKPILNNEAQATYSRQISKYNTIEKYTREKNYPENSKIKSKQDIEQLGINTFFFSDASSAIKKDVFVTLNGYDGKNLPINEDMYIAYKIIINNYKIKYCADSVIYHSHDFTLKELYNRYKLIGKFFKENKYLDQYGTNKSGSGLAKYIFKRALQEKNLKVLLKYPFDMMIRFIGMKVGKR